MKYSKDVIDMTDIFTQKGIDKLKVGQILFFKDGEDEVQYRIVKKTKKRVLVIRAFLYKPDEIDIVQKETKK